MPTHIKPFKVNNYLPLYGEVQVAAQRIQLYKVVYHTHPCKDNFKKYLREPYTAEGTLNTPMPEQWQKLVDITQLMLQYG